MSEVTVLFLTVVGLFVLALVVQSVSTVRFCALCASVFGTWVIFLALFWVGYFQSVTALAVLLGGSAVGLLYMFEKRAPSQLLLFRLPLYLSLIFFALALLGVTDGLSEVGIIVLSLWFLFILLYLYRNNPRLKDAVDRVVACCKEW